MNPFTIEEYKQTFLTKDRLEDLYDKNLFKIFVPKAYGGSQLSLREGMKELIKIAEIQGGLGWTLNLGAGANWFSGFFSDEATKEIFAAKGSVIAGSGFVSGNFSSNDDHYVIDGTWSRCTGASHATFFSLNAKNDQGEVKTFVVPGSQVELADEKWQIFGLRNTSSYAINVKQQRIPKRYSFTINTVANPNAYIVHRVPFETFARLCMSASFIGIVKCFVDKCKNGRLNDLSLKTCDQELLPVIEAATKNCFEWSEKVSEMTALDQMNYKLGLELKTSLGEFNVKLYDLVQRLFFQLGLPVVEEDNIVHWAYRDVLTAVQHYMVKP